MSWPSTDFEVGVQSEIDVSRNLARAVELFLKDSATKNVPNSAAFRDLKRAYEEYEETDLADV